MAGKIYGSDPPQGPRAPISEGQQPSGREKAHKNGQPPRDAHSPGAGELSPVVQRNIQSLQRRQQQREASATGQERLAQAITDFAGSMLFVYLHVLLFGFWIIANLVGIPGIPKWDPSFVVLAMVASVEAIFLSTFVLITQNRMAAAADQRADLDLQITLLTEHEVTKLVTLVSAMAEKMGVQVTADPEIDEIKRDVAPEAVLDEIETKG